MRFPVYREYKPSSVEWLGEVPAHWAVAPLKSRLVRNDGGVWGQDFDDEGTIVLRSTEQTVDGGWHVEEPARRRLTATELAGALLEDGDLVVTKSSGSSLHIGKTSLVTPEIAEMHCCFSNFMQRLRAGRDTSPRFVWYVLNSRVGRAQFDYQSNTTTGLANLSRGIIGALLAAWPARKEQDAITTFLDRETARIDALIAKKQRLIELLAEKRTALISQAVTKGLNPDAPMKDSGVEWLGEIPAHWQVSKIKYECVLVKDGTHLPPSRVGDGVPLLSVRNIIGSEFQLRDDDSMISEEDYDDLCRSFVPREGDVLLAIVGATLGKVAVIKEMPRFHVQRSLGVFRTRTNTLNNQFFRFFLESRPFQGLLWRSVGFSAQPGIYLGTLANFNIPLPSIKEQNAIVEHICEHVDKVGRLITRVHAAIEFMREYRSSLISAAVTGKINVRSLVKEREVA